MKISYQKNSLLEVFILISSANCETKTRKKRQKSEKSELDPPLRGMLRSSWDSPISAQRRQLVYLDLGKKDYGHTYHSFVKNCENVPFFWCFCVNSTPPQYEIRPFFDGRPSMFFDLSVIWTRFFILRKALLWDRIKNGNFEKSISSKVIGVTPRYLWWMSSNIFTFFHLSDLLK